MTRRWLHSDSVDEPLAFEAYAGATTSGSGTPHELYADRQGSILTVIDPASGVKVAEYTYDSFGKITQVAGSLSQPFAYTGREYDAESGLYYYRARTYDPAVGQFLQRDPIGFSAGDLNLYAYVENDPYNWSDPSGLFAAVDYTMATGMAVGTACVVTDACQNAGEATAKGIGGIFGALGGLAQRISDLFSNILESKNDGKRPKDTSGIERELAEAEAALAKIKSKPNKTPEDIDEEKRLKKRVKHLRGKLKKSEPHAIDPVRR